MTDTARVMAGIPAINMAFYRQIQFKVGDPAAWLSVGDRSILILRDIEMKRAREQARVTDVACPKDFEPAGGLSGDRETATAQATAECLSREGVTRVVSDRTLPLIFVQHLLDRGIQVDYDSDMGVMDRRHKTAEEVERLREAQAMTEGAMRMACELIARAEANDAGELVSAGTVLTSELVRARIDAWFSERGYSNPGSIIACGPAGADCHNLGSGALRTGQPIIVDIFPRNNKTFYNGDCTRTVVHGDISETLLKMHAAVVAAKAAATAATRAGVTGEDVHKATLEQIRAHGYEVGLPQPESPPEYCAMVHGTGHGIGLDVHEPPLLDFGGPELVVGDALTIEPGLYSVAIGGIRVEDMVVVTADGCENLNTLPEGLRWD